MTELDIRELYRTLSVVQTQIVQSTEIATASTCPFLFRLSYPFGVTMGHGDYVVGNAVHDLMSLALPGPILENWQQGIKEEDPLARTIEKESQSIIEDILRETTEVSRQYGNEVSSTLEYDIRDRYHGILNGFINRIIKKYEKPKRALTEVTITNVKSFHEGRLDAILEFDGNYGVIDWKTYNLNPVTGGSERWQLIANLLLANYRYTGNENQWDKCRFGAVIYYTGAYVPRMPIIPDSIIKVKNDREYAHEVLCGRSPPAKKPAFCPVCDTGAAASVECQFYHRDYQASISGMLPENYDKIRRLLIHRRYVTIEERAITHKHKFLINAVIDRKGEEEALKELEKFGIIQSGYKLKSVGGKLLTLEREQGSTFLEKRKPLRIIGKENSIPLLACVNVAGSIKESRDNELVIDLYGATAAARARQQLSTLPILIMPDEINLTRRIMEPMHKFHKLAANMLLPWERQNDGHSF